jgi:hypothetical protein
VQFRANDLEEPADRIAWRRIKEAFAARRNATSRRGPRSPRRCSGISQTLGSFFCGDPSHSLRQ